MRSERSQKVVAHRCSDCSSTTLSYRAICQNCFSKKIENVELDGRGRIFAYTIIRVAPEQFKGQEPYAIGIIRLDSGQLVSGRLVAKNLAKIENGMKVVLEKTDDMGLWFRA